MPGPTFGYQCLTAIVALPSFLANCRRSLKYRDKNFLLQRYAYNLPSDLKGRICLQCTGAGEIRAAVALVNQLKLKGYSVFISVQHPTEWDIANKNLPQVPCVYFPVELGFVVQRWLRKLAPTAVLIVEGELWPNFINVADNSDPPIPLALLNARLSRHITNPPKPARKTIAQVIRQMRCIIARDEGDANRFVSLGAEANCVKVLSNLKYAAVRIDVSLPRPTDTSISYALAISTRKGEEELILKAWLAQPTKNHLLVFMPRSPSRIPGLLKMLSPSGLNIGLHSRDRTPTQDMDIYLVDTLGEALPWLQHAEFVFVGGSLVPKYGGQNILEPVALGRACVVGAYTENFRSEVNALLDVGGLVQVADVESLRTTFSKWLSTPEEARLVGERGYHHVRTHQDVAERYIELLHKYKVVLAQQDTFPSPTSAVK